LAKQAAERALALDASLSMPWAALANSAQQSWPVDWPRNLALMDRAIDADPRNATAYLWRGIAWLTLGFFDRARAISTAVWNSSPPMRMRCVTRRWR
jgi:hypothetical protein